MDGQGRIFAVLAGRPCDASYDRGASMAHEAIQRASSRSALDPSLAMHARGNFSALPFGISYGRGQKAPKRLNVEKNGPLIAELRANAGLCRMASYSDSEPCIWPTPAAN